MKKLLSSWLCEDVRLTRILREQLTRHEGERRFAYDDHDGKPVLAPKGNLSIGIGRNLQVKGLDPSEITFLLENDIREVLQICRKRLPWFNELNIPRKAVVANMVFNMGLGDDNSGFLTFKNTIEAIKRGDFEDAARRMLVSLWAQQVGNRAKELSEIMRRGGNLTKKRPLKCHQCGKEFSLSKGSRTVFCKECTELKLKKVKK